MDSQAADTTIIDMAWPTADALITPEPSHAVLPDESAAAIGKIQADRIHAVAKNSMTPPPLTQAHSSNSNVKSRTPTPTYSHISTPPPTVEVSSSQQLGQARMGNATARTMTIEQIDSASAEDLRTKVMELQAAYQEAKMSAAHHQLQYQMLSQETAAAIDRMAVEARMAQYESDVIQSAQEARRAITSQPSRTQDGTIPVQKDIYQRMCREIQHLNAHATNLETSHRTQAKTIGRQEDEIALLTDKIILMRDRIRSSRETQTRHRDITATPRSAYSTPRRLPQPQPFAALLQASEMASQEAHSATPKRTHTRNVHSLSSLPATPSRSHKQQVYQTPRGSQQHHYSRLPATAPVHRSIYSQPLPVPQDEDTVSGSSDSEAETEILEPDAITESQATRTAQQILRHSAEDLRGSYGQRGSNVRQTTLVGAVRKPGVVRAGPDEEGGMAKKRKRGEVAVGLGIQGMRD